MKSIFLCSFSSSETALALLACNERSRGVRDEHNMLLQPAELMHIAVKTDGCNRGKVFGYYYIIGGLSMI